MNEEQLKNYGSDNVNALEIYKKAYLTKMPEKLEGPKDIPIGLILHEYWCDSCSYYQVIKTTDKSVILIEIPSIQVSFDHEGDGTGYSYIMPDFVRTHKLVSDYKEFVKKYGDDRRTELAQIEIPKAEKEIAEVIPEDVVVITSQSGLIKKVPKSSFKVQRRGGKGVKTVDDVILDIVSTNTIDTMMFFTNLGKMYRTVVDNIPNGSNTTKGVPIDSLVKLEKGERVVAVSSLHRASTPEFVIFVTKNGMVKKTRLDEYFKTNRNSGVVALKVKENDEVASVLFMDKEPLVLITEQGFGIRFNTSDIGAIGRVAMGVKGIKLNDIDAVLTALPIHKDTDNIALFAETGLGKKIAINEIPLQGRGGKGVIV